MFGSTNPEVPSSSVLLAACTRAVGAWDPALAVLPLGTQPADGGESLLFSERQNNPAVVRFPAFELALSVGRSGWDCGRPPYLQPQIFQP